MYCINHIFQPDEALPVLNEIAQNIEQERYQSVLIQLYSGVIDPKRIKRTLDKIYQTLNPICQQHCAQELILIGATTAGEIYGGVMLEEQMVLNVCGFQNTKLQATLLENRQDESFLKGHLGKTLAEKVIQKNSKACILLMDGLTINGEDVAQDFNQRAAEIAQEKPIISGGMAADNLKFQETWVFFNQNLRSNAAVAVSFNSNTLRACNTFNLSWRCLGPEMLVTKSTGATVYEINNRPIIEFYRHYLGNEIVNHMPESAIEFPLIIQDKGVPIARSMIQVNENGSIVFAGNLPQGSRVRFGVADKFSLLEGSQKMQRELQNFGAEGVFVFSCSVRKSFFGEELQNELVPLDGVAPLSGFFTYGEIYRTTLGKRCDATLLNITTTLLALSEAPKKRYESFINRSAQISSDHKKRAYHALINLATTSYHDLYNEAHNGDVFATALLQNSTSLIIDNHGKIVQLSEPLLTNLPPQLNAFVGESFNKILEIDCTFNPIEDWLDELPNLVNQQLKIPLTLQNALGNSIPQLARFYQLQTSDLFGPNYLIVML
ncbi:hypothetical protein THMIRHAS_01480 [Thiosulfatimonas sediminis]|uniref:FIST domain-containing protein n=1 Tax=Thiosulfatimonas sediminis TaxID=2675054 RepID=A0A6F8PRN2_9GAMM|nr:FIST N-terminal domain-containing protein [Thiosulfatimonas sediminis]BBP44775.1 hypothetical protein THMIRHAS_01480 [Thiosulfatimonas sediminis]